MCGTEVAKKYIPNDSICDNNNNNKIKAEKHIREARDLPVRADVRAYGRCCRYDVVKTEKKTRPGNRQEKGGGGGSGVEDGRENPRNEPKGIIKIDWIRGCMTLKQRLVLI